MRGKQAATSVILLLSSDLCIVVFSPQDREKLIVVISGDGDVTNQLGRRIVSGEMAFFQIRLRLEVGCYVCECKLLRNKMPNLEFYIYIYIYSSGSTVNRRDAFLGSERRSVVEGKYSLKLDEDIIIIIIREYFDSIRQNKNK